MSMKRINFVFLAMCLLMLGTFVFSANPVFTGEPTMTKAYNVTGDRNYYDFNTIMYSPVISDADLDLNQDSCKIQFSISPTIWFTPGTLTGFDFNTDINKCVFNLNYEWGNTGSMDVRYNITDDAGHDTNSNSLRWWLDNTAPMSGATSNDLGQVTLVTSDYATPTGGGVGIKHFYYNLDGAGWTDAGAVTDKIVNVTGVGTHTIQFYATDNFDNNEWVTEGSYWTKTFPVNSTDCSSLIWIVPLILLVLAYFGVKTLMNGGKINMLVAMIIALIIAMVIIQAFFSSICTVV